MMKRTSILDKIVSLLFRDPRRAAKAFLSSVRAACKRLPSPKVGLCSAVVAAAFVVGGAGAASAETWTWTPGGGTGGNLGQDVWISADGLTEKTAADGIDMQGGLAFQTGGDTFIVNGTDSVNQTGVISGGPAANPLVKQGTGTLRLDAINTYGGGLYNLNIGTRLEEGTIGVANQSSLGTASLVANAGVGNTVKLEFSIVAPDPAVITNRMAVQSGTLAIDRGVDTPNFAEKGIQFTTNGVYTMGFAGGAFDVSGGNVIFTGAVDGAAPIEITGNGTLTGGDTYTSILVGGGIGGAKTTGDLDINFDGSGEFDVVQITNNTASLVGGGIGAMSADGNANVSTQSGMLISGNAATGEFNSAGLQSTLDALRAGGSNTAVLNKADGDLAVMAAAANAFGGVAVGGGVGAVANDGDATTNIGNGSMIYLNDAGYGAAPTYPATGIGFGGGTGALANGGNATVNINGEVEFWANNATAGGGAAAAFASGGDAAVNVLGGTIFEENSATGDFLNAGHFANLAPAGATQNLLNDMDAAGISLALGGGVLAFSDTGNASLNLLNADVTFDGNVAGQTPTTAGVNGVAGFGGAAAVFAGSGNATISSHGTTGTGIVQNNKAQATGDAATLDNPYLKAGSGGGYFVVSMDGNALFESYGNEVFASNTADGDGGAMFVKSFNGSAMVQLDGNLGGWNNSAQGDGGMVYVNGATDATVQLGGYTDVTDPTLFVPSNLEIGNSSAGGDGGAIYAKATSGTALVNAGLLYHNGTLTAGGSGGMIYADSEEGDATVAVTKVDLSTASSSSAANDGGLIYINAANQATFYNAGDMLVHDSAAQAGSGGAIYANGGTDAVAQIDGNVTGWLNSAAEKGGFAYVNGADNASLWIKGDVALNSNSAGSDGGAFSVNAGTGDAVVQIDGSLFSGGDNISGGSGGTISATSAGGNVGVYLNSMSFVQIDGDPNPVHGRSVAQQDGGVVSIVADQDVEFVVADGMIVDAAKTIEGSGGVNDIKAGGDVTAYISSMTVTGNLAKTSGGVNNIESGGDVSFLIDGDIKALSNRADRGDGGVNNILAEGKIVMHTGGSSTGNYVANWAYGNGGVDNLEADIVERSSSADNEYTYSTAGLSGGVIRINANTSGTYATSGNNVYSDNMAVEGDGGAISMYSHTGGELIYSVKGDADEHPNGVTNEFDGNRAGKSGGAISMYSKGGDVTYYADSTTTNIFDGNRAAVGGGIFLGSIGDGTTQQTVTFWTESNDEYTDNSSEFGGAVTLLSNWNAGAMLTGDNLFEGNDGGALAGGITVLAHNSAFLQTDGDNTYTNNEGGLGGGMAVIGGNSTEVIINGNDTYIGNSAWLGGAKLIGTISGDVIYTENADSVYTGNSATISGGAIFIGTFDGNATGNFNNLLTLDGNSTEGVGGGVSIVTADGDATGNFKNVIATGNSAGESGGALAVIAINGNSNLNIDGTVSFTDNTAVNGSGGAMFVFSVSGNATTTIGNRDDYIAVGNILDNIVGCPNTIFGNALSSVNFDGNTAGLFGGGIGDIAVFGDALVEITAKGQFVNNIGTFGGGGIAAVAGAGKATVDVAGEVKFEKNSTGGDGGAILALTGYDVTAEQAGDALSNDATVKLTGISKLTENDAAGDGGAIAAKSYYGDAVVEISKIGDIEKNTAGGYGGGVVAWGSDNATIAMSGIESVTGNTAGRSGGGLASIACDGDSLVDLSGIVDISGNSAELYGGGAFLWSGGVNDGDNATMMIDNSGTLFNGNTAGVSGGGAAFLANQTAMLDAAGSVTFTGNTAKVSGGGLYMDAKDVVINADRAVSFVKNDANVFGGGAALIGRNSVKGDFFGAVDVLKNTAVGSGAGFAAVALGVDGIDMTFAGKTTVNKNVAGDFGGGMTFVSNGNTKVEFKSTAKFDQNVADSFGAGLASVAFGNTTIKFDSSTEITNNVANGAKFDLANADFGIGHKLGEFYGDDFTVEIDGSFGAGLGTLAFGYSDVELGDNLKLTDNVVDGFGAGVGSIALGGAARILADDNAVITGNISTGSLTVDYSFMTVDGVEADKFTIAGGAGIGAYGVGGSYVKLGDSATVSENSSKGFGGAIASLSDAYSFVYIGDDAKITDNVATGANSAGGAIAVEGAGFGGVYIGNNLLLDGNSAVGNGGAIYSNATDVDTFAHVQIGTNLTATQNKTGSGGAIWAKTNVAIDTGASFIGNEAKADGGAIWAGSSVYVSGNTKFIGNKAGGQGGAIYAAGNGDEDGNNFVVLDATGGNILFARDEQGYFPYDNAIYMEKDTTLVVGGEDNVYLFDNIDTNGGGNSFEKYGTGMVQFAAKANYLNYVGAGGTMDIYDGTVRVTEGSRLYSWGDDAKLESWGTLAGGGYIFVDNETVGFVGPEFVLHGTVSPDSDTLTAWHTSVAAEKRFGTLTLAGDTQFAGTTLDFNLGTDKIDDDAKKWLRQSDTLRVVGTTDSAVKVAGVTDETVLYAWNSYTGEMVVDQENGLYYFDNDDDAFKAAFYMNELKVDQFVNGGKYRIVDSTTVMDQTFKNTFYVTLDGKAFANRDKAWLSVEDGNDFADGTLEDMYLNMKHVNLALNWLGDKYKGGNVWDMTSTHWADHFDGQTPEIFENLDTVYFGTPAFRTDVELAADVKVSDMYVHAGTYTFDGKDDATIFGVEKEAVFATYDEYGNVNGVDCMAGSGSLLITRSNAEVGTDVTFNVSVDMEGLLTVERRSIAKFNESVRVGKDVNVNGAYAAFTNTANVGGNFTIDGGAWTELLGNDTVTVGKEFYLESGSLLGIQVVENKLVTGTFELDGDNYAEKLATAQNSIDLVDEPLDITKPWESAGKGKIKVEKIITDNDGFGIEDGTRGAMEDAFDEKYALWYRNGYVTDERNSEVDYFNLKYRSFKVHEWITDEDNDWCYTGNKASMAQLIDKYIFWKPNANAEELREWLYSIKDEVDLCSFLTSTLGGELAADAQTLAFWNPQDVTNRRLYERFEQRVVSCDPCAPRSGRATWELWGEANYAKQDVDSDGNAYGYDVKRWGAVVGADKRFSSRVTGGAMFAYGNPKLNNKIGKVEADDYTFGLYGTARLYRKLYVNGYLGYGHQEYDYKRAAGGNASYDGDAMYASLEFFRPVKYRKNVTLFPLLAIDFQKSWTDGFTEKGVTKLPLHIAHADMEQTILRLGLNSKIRVNNRLNLHTRLQYGVLVGGDERGVAITSLADNRGFSRPLYGVNKGREILNVGIGGEWKLNNRSRLFGDFDYDYSKNADTYGGQVGIVTNW